MPRFPVLPLLLALTCATLAPDVRALDYHDYESAQVAIRNAGDRVRLADAAVAQAVNETLKARYDQPHDWSVVDRALDNLGSALDASLPEISRQSAIIRQFDSAYRNEAFSLGQPFAGNLQAVNEQKRRMLDLARDENAKLAKLNQSLARVNRDIGQAAMDHMVDTMDGFLPTKESLAGEAVIVTVTAILAPPLLAGAGIAMGAAGTFNSMASMYYGMDGVAAQAKAFGQVKTLLLERKRIVEANLKTLMDAARRLDETSRALTGSQTRMDEYRRRLQGAAGDEDRQAEDALAQYRQRQAENLRRALGEPARPSGMGDWSSCRINIPDIAPGEYASEAASFLGSLDSAAAAVEGGGGPLAYEQTEADWESGWLGKYRPVAEQYQQRQRQDAETTNRCSNAYMQAYYAARDDAERNRAYQAYLACACPARQALMTTYRELRRQWLVMERVSGPARDLDARVRTTVYFRTREFWSEFGQWQARMDEARQRVSAPLSYLSDYSYLQREADALDANVSRYGGNAEEERDGLLAQAGNIRRTGERVREVLKDYDAAQQELQRVRMQGTTALNKLLVQYGKLINDQPDYFFGRISNYGWGDGGGSGPQDRPRNPSPEWFAQQIDGAFAWTEPPFVASLRAMSWEALAARFEAKAAELQFYVDWADQFRYRQSMAMARMSRMLRTVTPPAQTGAGVEPPDLYIRREFTGGDWAAIGRDAGEFLSAADLARLPWARVESLDTMLPWRKLYSAQTALLYRVAAEMRPTVQARNNNPPFFVPADDTVFAPLETRWRGLRAVCERFDRRAAAERDVVKTAADELDKTVQPALDTWKAMPEGSRNMLTNEYQQLLRHQDWLRTYLRLKTENLNRLLDNDNNGVSARLDDYLTAYPERLAAWRKQQEQERLRFEAEERARLAAEKARLDAERARAAEEKRLADAFPQEVRAMYDEFRRAYESRDEAAVMRFLDDHWEAGDGTRLSDLSANLRRTFSVFDEVRYELSNLQIAPQPNGEMVAEYDLVITSRQYSADIRHVERSAVREAVGRDSRGRMRILRTLGGRFWSIE